MTRHSLRLTVAWTVTLAWAALWSGSARAATLSSLELARPEGSRHYLLATPDSHTVQRGDT